MITLEIACLRCHKPQHLIINESDLETFKSGKRLVQDIFPYLNAGERELLINRICPTCWGEMFSDDSIQE